MTGTRPPTAVDPPAGPDGRRELRRVLGSFATGVTLVTTGRENPRGMTANSFASVSLEPALVLICVLRSAALHDTLLAEKAFAVSVLSAEQEPTARRFADRRRPRGAREFEGVDVEPGRHTGAPILVGALAWLECGLTAVHDGGDHSILLGSVLDAGRGGDDPALLFHGGAFHHLSPTKV
ncbi:MULTISPECIES: flavin reductase family protein [unclassified Streptomyces]|uniref:Flavin reductase family protein n=1 Tax=Streptomyces evansiae TaxID=3075535 RepID=A0ABU2R7Z1_9ACTN|nr:MULTISPECIES: flavin reductase family protein [unclassified Streptomyces]EFL00101.1 monooxygenase [Streptomyces sp. SPB78]MDT0412189.1 flavin reductase family protein [Streptomyces sp. DSM 41979]MYQ60522.1 flavin reductase [Streptomyces sp. SID4926]MYR28776.1 flavin reductase [Streptomyces sp. SID4945]SCD58135.1 NADH-FMN oxidoreductase RutF, flavin reductase (DIM6/NTAB) family [Streptomyces sp. TverLS-915]